MDRFVLHRLLILALFCPAIATGYAAAQSGPGGPPDLRTRDQHQNLLVVADPYVIADRYTKSIFGKKSPYEGGIIAIEMYLRNDNDSPIRLDLSTIRLVVSASGPGDDRQQLEPLTPDDVADRIILNGHVDPSIPRGRPGRPLPFPKPNKGKDWNTMDSAMRSIALADMIPAHATTQGFLFFDLDHQFDAIRRSHVYIPDLSFIRDKNALLFFDIDLAPPPAAN